MCFQGAKSGDFDDNVVLGPSQQYPQFGKEKIWEIKTKQSMMTWKLVY